MEIEKNKRSWWPYLICAFLGTVVIVNMAFLYIAVSTNDGLVDKDYYEKGILYSKTLEDEAKLGWSIEFELNDKASAASRNEIRVSIFERDGSVLRDAAVNAILMRPATDNFDKESELTFRDSVYIGSFFIPLAGYWDIKVIVEKNGGTMERIFRVHV